MAYRTREEWALIVETFKKSGQTQKAWCQENGINVKSLGAHVRSRTGQKQLKRSNDEWTDLIDKQQASGINRNIWCQENGISYDSMSSAIKRLSAQEEKTKAPEWVELSQRNIAIHAPTNHLKKSDINCYVKIRSGGLEIEADVDYPMEKLTFLIRELVVRQVDSLVKPC
ncbi:MAG: hypothetical protein LBV07_04345 [Syntrophobacterales bacterium]|jgi:hypothetical protein|nr:hypothetical protein [Syntrophobacterales bacterium]